MILTALHCEKQGGLGPENTEKPLRKGSRRQDYEKTTVFLGFPRFFALQALALSRMIGLTKEEIEHFRIVLFFATLRLRRANGQFSSKSKRGYREVLHG
jgi:hypothetical protein